MIKKKIQSIYKCYNDNNKLIGSIIQRFDHIDFGDGNKIKWELSEFLPGYEIGYSKTIEQAEKELTRAYHKSINHYNEIKKKFI